MTTAATLIRHAMLEIGKRDANQTLKPEDYRDAYERLNFLVASEPIIPNYTVITSSDQEITSPDYCIRYLIKALALDLAPQYGTLQSYSSIQRDKEEAFDAISQALIQIKAPTVNGNLPLGSGNKMPGDWLLNDYYYEEDNGILTETNQQIIVEDDTE